jgi:aryl-alcohol dehydrogenase-like predicted oxidoreductase
MAHTRYVTLGNSGLRVSPLCLGAMTFGNEWGFGSEPQTARRVIDRYLDWGGNFIDTANIYNKGHSEKIIGEHLGPKRDRVVIATKFCGNLFRDDPNAGGAGRKAIFDQCAHSLRRLKTDYIDLYLMHFEDPHTPVEETMRALDDLVRAGKVRYIGFSDTFAWKCARAQTLARLKGWAPLVALQIEYSLLERTVEGELIPMARELGMGVTPWSPLKGGILTGKYTREKLPRPHGGEGGGEGRYKPDSRYINEATFTIVDALVKIGGQVGATPAQVALRWVMDRPGVSSTIIGARTMEQLEANLGAMEVELSPEHTRELDELSAPKLNFPHEFLSRAGMAIHGGLTVNGLEAEPWPLSPEGDGDRH